MVEVRDGLAKTMLDLEEKCCRGEGWGQEIGISFLFDCFGQGSWASGAEIFWEDLSDSEKLVKYLLNCKYFLPFFTSPSLKTLVFFCILTFVLFCVLQSVTYYQITHISVTNL